MKTFALSLYLLPVLMFTGCHLFDSLRSKKEVLTEWDVPYATDSIKEHRLDLFLPAGRSSFPVVVFVHGGFWKNQDRRYYRVFTGLYSNIGFALAKRGIGSAIISYRLFPDVKIEGQLEDVKTALAWTRENISSRGGDPDHLFLMGHSSGGHIASLLCSDLEMTGGKEIIAGCIGISPILELREMEKEKGDEFNASTTYPFFGQGRLDEFSPMGRMNRLRTPALFLFGDRDYPFIRQSADSTILKSNPGIQSFVVEGYDHADMVLKIGTDQDAITSKIAEFILSQASR